MTTPPPQQKTNDREKTDRRIFELFKSGQTLAQIIATGTNAGLWGRREVEAALAARGVRVDLHGRLIPSASRPVDQLRQVGSTQSEDEVVLSAENIRKASVGTILTLAKASEHPAIRDKAQRILGRVEALRLNLVEVITADERNRERRETEEKLRARLAEVEAERGQLRAVLGVNKPGRRRGASNSYQLSLTGDFNHGSLIGWRTHRARGEDPCAECQTGKDAHMEKLHASRRKQP